jgi:hypothetical protein
MGSTREHVTERSTLRVAVQAAASIQALRAGSLILIASGLIAVASEAAASSRWGIDRPAGGRAP